MTPIERAARAAEHLVITHRGITLTKRDKEAIAQLPEVLRAALRQFRIVSGNMLDFGAEADAMGSRQNAEKVWVAMIDAMLEEG